MRSRNAPTVNNTVYLSCVFRSMCLLRLLLARSGGVGPCVTWVGLDDSRLSST